MSNPCRSSVRKGKGGMPNSCRVHRPLSRSPLPERSSGGIHFINVKTTSSSIPTYPGIYHPLKYRYRYIEMANSTASPLPPDLFDQTTLVSLASTLVILGLAYGASLKTLSPSTSGSLRFLFIWYGYVFPVSGLVLAAGGGGA